MYTPPRILTQDWYWMFSTFFLVTVMESTISLMGTSLMGLEWYTCLMPVRAFLTSDSLAAST